MEPFFVPSPRGPLFAWRHVPATPRAARACAVVCNPFGEEFVLAHRSLHTLAKQLERSGVRAVRFDWSGSGDSAGEADAISLEAWREDLRLVMDAAEERAPRREAFALVGVRLGAALALERACEDDRVRALVLWDPVLRGSSYRDELERAHRGRSLPGGFARRHGEEVEMLTEIAGFPLPERFREEIEALDLTSARPAIPLLLVQTKEDPLSSRLVEEWRSGGSAVEVCRALDQRVWEEDDARTVVPLKLLKRIVEWIEACS